MVDTLAVALEMALNGEGIALVNGPFVDQDLAAGRLVQPIAHKAVCPGAWGAHLPQRYERKSADPNFH